ncbi:MAG: DUF3426 domain-containing protein [Pseudomonadota bacterium]|nr:DUF3426 domain-containing protein [Pseudomonadota bacterium]
MEEPAAGDSATPDTAPGNDAASGSSGSAQPKAEREPIVSEIYESEEEARGAPLQDEEMSGGLDIDSAAAEFDELTNTPEASARADIIVRKRRRGTGLVGIAVGWALLLIGWGALGYFGVTERAQVVQALPGSAWVYERLGLPVNVRGLEFRKLAYGWTAVAGRQMLEVSGEVVNVSDRPRKVPSIEFALRDAQNTEIYQWTEDLRAETVPVGGVFPFKASIDSPPKGAANLQVRFARGS